MSSAIRFKLDQSKILLSGNGLRDGHVRIGVIFFLSLLNRSITTVVSYEAQ